MQPDRRYRYQGYYVTPPGFTEHRGKHERALSARLTDIEPKLGTALNAVESLERALGRKQQLTDDHELAERLGVDVDAAREGTDADDD
jgi:hypothetical protein